MNKKVLVVVSGGVASLYADEGVDVVCVDLDEVMVKADMIPVHSGYSALFEFAGIADEWPLADDGRLNDADHLSASGQCSESHDGPIANYVGKKGLACPNCGSRNIDSGPFDADSDQVIAETSCSDCGSSWKGLYRLTGYGDLVAMPLKVIGSVSERGYFSNENGWVFNVKWAKKYPSTFNGQLPLTSGNDAQLIDAEKAEDFLLTDFTVGDGVHWNNPYHWIASGHFTITKIERACGKLFFGSDTCRLSNAEGERVHAFARELS